MIVQDQGLQQEILTRIDALTEKIGVTAEYLWPHLVKLELARGLGLLVGAIVFSAVATVLMCSALYCEGKRNDHTWDDVNAWKMAIGVVMGVGAVIFVIIFMVLGLPSIIAPEAAAFKNLLNL